MNRYRPPASPTRVCRRALTALLAGLAAATAALADAPPAVAPPSTAPASRPSAVTPLPASTRPATAADYSAYRERWFTLPTKSDPRLTHHAYESAAMSARVGYHLYLPLGYDDPANAARRYPVLYWLHGLNQSESSDWFPPDVLSVAVGGGAIPPVIVVFAAGGGRSFYCDAPDQNILPETTIVRELIPHVDATYRTIAARGGRAIQGVSMGGF
ncbi:MAG: putative esterase, partial [Phycisphaerales bacterium]|nr:putative esterase [Phycisphaerales bacterium]